MQTLKVIGYLFIGYLIVGVVKKFVWDKAG